MTAAVLQANARTIPLADNTVDLIVTSPPYFALRSYQDGGEHYAGQIGSEATPAEFLDALLEVTAECARVLKPSGSMFVNLGDKYSGGSSGESNLAKLGERLGTGGGHSDAKAKRKSLAVKGMQPKSLIGIPWRYALRCIDELGLILRAEIIWSKPNGLPESVTDRVRRSHETWFHFVLQPRYFSAVDEIREEHTWSRQINPAWSESRKNWGQGSQGRPQKNDGFASLNPLGKLPGSVWTIPTEPLTVPDHLGVDHFAAFPTEWPRRIIRGWSPSGVCTACGEGRRPVAEKEAHGEKLKRNLRHIPGYEDPAGEGQRDVRYEITGYSCACLEPTASTRRSVILDPFGGTGTVALVATALGRHGISIDMSADYNRLAKWRTTDPRQLARAARKPWTPPREQVDGQMPLFDEAVS